MTVAEESRDDHSDPGPYRDLITVCAAGTLATIIGLLAATTFYFWSPLSDPVDVVGLPLLTGYSEATEQWSFYTFVLVTISASAILRRRIENWPWRIVMPIGAIGILSVLSLTAWNANASTFPATVLGVVAYLVGAAWWRWTDRPAEGAALNATVGIGTSLWTLGFPELPLTLTSHWVFLVAVAVWLAGLWWVYGRLPLSMRSVRWGWLYVAAALLVVVGTLTASFNMQAVGFVGAAAFLLGAAARPLFGARSVLGRPHWFLTVAVLVGVSSLSRRWETLGLLKPLLAVAGGAGGMSVLLASGTWWERGIAMLRGRAGSLVKWIPPTCVATIAAVTLLRPWWGFVTGSLVVLLWWIRPGPRKSSAFAVLAAIILSMGILPRGGPVGLDNFHDGQILSAIWEFESGRTLYADVFPLRSFEFYVGWLSRQLIATNVRSYQLGLDLLSFLPIGGAYLLSYAWSRSALWSFATALVLAANCDLSGRQGVHLWLAAVAVFVFRSARARNLIWLVAVAAPAGCLGFDAFVSFVGAAVATVFFVGPPGRYGRKVGLAGIGRRAMWSALLLMAAISSFTVSLGLLQGRAAVMAYWWLLYDNVRTYAAFCGMPLPWDGWQRWYLIAALQAVGLWAAIGIAAWPGMSAGRRRAWMFLLVQFVLLANYGLARSDAPHLTSVVYPCVLFASIGLFEFLRAVRRRGSRTILVDCRIVALAVAAIAVWLVPKGETTPRDLIQLVREARTNTKAEPTPVPIVLERLETDDYLLEVGGALMSYATRRHNPTRHSLAYCISSPAEQRIAMAALRENPPKMIAWQYTGPNQIANPLRFYVLSQYIFRHYRPMGQLGYFLEPARPGWQDGAELPPGFLGKLSLGQLALRWGESRAPSLGDRLMASQRLDVTLSDPSGATNLWTICGPINSQRFNYLHLCFSCTRPDPQQDHEPRAVLLFLPGGSADGQFDLLSEITFTVLADGRSHNYLIPVGCSPGWSWRTSIAELSLEMSPGYCTSRPDAEVWSVDDWGE